MESETSGKQSTSWIYRITGIPRNTADIASSLRRFGKTRIQVISEAGTRYKPFVYFDNPEGTSRRRVYLPDDGKTIDDVLTIFGEWGISAGYTVCHGKLEG